MSPSRGLHHLRLHLRLNIRTPTLHLRLRNLHTTPRNLYPLSGRPLPPPQSPLLPLTHAHPTQYTLPTLLHSPTPPRHQLYISTSVSPFFNLSLEHHIFSHYRPPADTTTPSSILLLYINASSVVIGRNQNVWREVNIPEILATHEDIAELEVEVIGEGKENVYTELVRRRSGGGAVYHDLGNLNYCVIVPRERFLRDEHAEMVVRALGGMEGGNKSGSEGSTVTDSTTTITTATDLATRKLGVNVRHDIVLTTGTVSPSGRITEESGEGVGDVKVSGSAYKISRDKAYHHGTLLVTADTRNLGRFLGSKARDAITGRGVQSVRSPVTNIVTGGGRGEEGAEMVMKAAERIVREWGVKYGLGEDVWGVEGARKLDGGCEVGICYVTEEELLNASYGDAMARNEVVVESTETSGGNADTSNTSLPVLQPPTVADTAASVRDEIVEGIMELRSPEWVFGQTPKFTFTIPLDGSGEEVVCIEANRGIITDVTGPGVVKDKGVPGARADLVGRKFDGGVVGHVMEQHFGGRKPGVGKWCKEVLGRADSWVQGTRM